MELIKIRKVQTTIERVHHDRGPTLAKPIRRGSIAAVLQNPFAGRYEADLMPFMEALDPLARDLANELVENLGGKAEIEGYGKGSIVGVMGEIEHAAAWHTPGGAGLRAALGDPKAMVPASKKVGNAGTQLDVPMLHIRASYVRSHYDVLPIVVPDAPRPDELVVCLVLTTGSRPHARLGGLSAENIIGEDGLR